MRLMLVAAVSAATLLSGAAFAQPQPPGGGHPHRGGFACAIKDGKATEMLGRARSELAVTDAQAQAWERFAAKVQEAVLPLGERCDRDVAPQDRRAAMPDRLARMEQGQRAMLDATVGVRAAVEGLWPVLTPDQRAKAGRLMSPRGMMPEGRGGMGRRGMGSGGMGHGDMGSGEPGHPPMPQSAPSR